jgi:hypothetical protein
MVTIALVAAVCGANTWADVERFGQAKSDWLPGVKRVRIWDLFCRIDNPGLMIRYLLSNRGRCLLELASKLALLPA